MLLFVWSKFAHVAMVMPVTDMTSSAEIQLAIAEMAVKVDHVVVHL